MTALEIVQVEYRYTVGKEIQPLHFVFAGQIKNVQDIGRRWQDEDGEHMLVMVEEERVFELVFQSLNKQWFLRSITSFRSKV
jgi:hypothetical protein